jgi:hypothetical protein
MRTELRSDVRNVLVLYLVLGVQCIALRNAVLEY